MAGVLAHEVSHLHHGDTSIMRPSDQLARLTRMVSWLGLCSLLVTLPLDISSDLLQPFLVSSYLAGHGRRPA